MSSSLHTIPLAVRTVDDTAVITVMGRDVSLDAETADVVGAQLLALAAEPSSSRMVLDLGNVQYLSSRALAKLVGVKKKLRAAGGQLAVRNVSPLVHEVFATAGLTALLDVREPEGSSGVVIRAEQLIPPMGVLVADDDKGVCNVLAAALRRDGFAVWVAGSGQEAVELYRQHQKAIHVALLDVRMPWLDGPETLAALHWLNPALPCCFMSGGDSSYTEQTLLKVGAARVFRKPFVVGEVVQTLHRLAVGSTLPT